MRIIISGHFIATGRVGGAEHMTYNLVRGIAEAGSETILVCGCAKALSPDFVSESRQRGRQISEHGGSGIRFLAEQRACFSPDLRSDAILFPNYALPPVVPARLGRRGVVIHDFQYRHFPQHFSATKRRWLAASHRHALARAETVIFISEFVRQDAIRLYGRQAQRGIVIPNPISWERFGPAGARHPFDGRPYILSVAAHYPHKRLDVLIRAFHRMAEREPDALLVLAGQRASDLVSVGEDELRLGELVERLGLSDRVRLTGYVDDHALGNLYRHASLFALPSMFEGFGMPAVEALGFGIPCLTTGLTALPETTLGLAQYIDRAGDIDEWAGRLETMIHAGRLPSAAAEHVRQTYHPQAIGRRYNEALTP